MDWLVVTVIAIFSRAFYSVSVKSMSSNVKVSASMQAVLLTLLAALLTLLLVPFLGFSTEGISQNWKIILVLAVSQGVGNVIYFRGQEHLDAGTTQVALSSMLIWTALLSALFLGSSYSVRQYLGMVLLGICILFANSRTKGAAIAAKGIAYILVSAVVFSVFVVAGADLSSKINIVTYLLATYLGASIFSILGLHKTFRRDVGYLKANLTHSIKSTSLASITSLLYFMLIFYAFRLSPDPGVVAVLANAQVVTTVFVAAILLQERERIFRKSISALIVLLAAYLISGV